MKTFYRTKDPNSLARLGDGIVEESDKFKREVNVYTVNVYANYSYKPSACFSVLFRSNPDGEKLYIVSSYSDKTRNTNTYIEDGGCLIICLDDKEIITLKEHTEEEDKDDFSGETHFLFPITREDYTKCCTAKKMSIRVMKQEGIVGAEYSGISNLILALRTIWNKAVDSSQYSDSVIEYRRMFESIIFSLNESAEKQNVQLKEKRQIEKKVIIAAFGGLALFVAILLLIFFQ